MTPNERLITALKGDVPDRVPCFISILRWIRYHYGCACPRHQLKFAEEYGLDIIIFYAQYIWQSISNDYIYTAGGGYNYSPSGIYGDLPDVNVELRVENSKDHVWYYRTFDTPAGKLRDVIQWARPNVGYGDGPNPHRVEPLVKTQTDLEALKYLFPPPRKDLLQDIPMVIKEIGKNALLAAYDATHVGGWGMEVLGPEGMLTKSVTDPELFKGVCRLAQNVHLRNLKAMLERGIKVVYDSWFQCGPSVGWSPETYNTVFLPLIKESVTLTHEFEALYIYQDDGRMKDIIPLLVDAGVDVLGGLQPPDIGDVILKEVKDKYGSKVALLGGLDPCYTFDMGSTKDVREKVRQAIEDAGANGGYIIGTGEAVSPNVSAEFFRAALQAAKEYGFY